MRGRGWIARAASALLLASALALGPGSGAARAGEPPDARLSLHADPLAVAREAVAGAQHSIRAVLYKLEDPEIAEALAAALRRGVEVRIVADAHEARRSRSRIRELRDVGAEVRVWKKGKLHAKFAIVDARVLTGSYNWTRSAAAANVELLLDFDDPGTVARFGALFDELWREATPLAAPAQKPAPHVP
jgi:mitochondrial cardiolipin hydrolase